MVGFSFHAFVLQMSVGTAMRRQHNEHDGTVLHVSAKCDMWITKAYKTKGWAASRALISLKVFN